MRHAARSFQGEVFGLARSDVLAGDGVTRVCADLLVPDAARRAIEQVRATHLLHLAWDVTPGRYWQSATNLEWFEASLRLFRLFVDAGGQRIISVGTCAEYAWDQSPLDEIRTPLQPGTFYGISKNALRAMLEGAAEPLGVSWAWARLFWLYGPGEGKGRLLSDIARSLLVGKEASISSGRQRRDYLHVDDVARALVQIVVSGHQGTINVGSGRAVEIRHIAETFADRLGHRALLRVGGRPDGPDEKPLVVANVERLAAIGFRPEYNLETGLDHTADWWLANAKQPSANSQMIET